MEQHTTLNPGESRDFAEGYVARSWRTERPYYAERTGDELSPEFATFAEARAWLEAPEFTMADREADLRAALNFAVELADGDAVEACAVLIEAVANFLDVDEYTIGEPLPSMTSGMPS